MISPIGEFKLPPLIAAQFAELDQPGNVFTEHGVLNILQAASKELGKLEGAEDAGRWAEIIGFSLTYGHGGENPWDTYFIPMGSGTDDTGKTVYFPDIAQCSKGTDAYWQARAIAVRNPILQARYADLAWDLGPALGTAKRPVAMARLAVKAYLASLPLVKELFTKIDRALRALALATMVRNADGVAKAKAALLELHATAIAEKTSWWRVFDALSSAKHAGVTESELTSMVSDLEGLLVEFSNTENPKSFNPHTTKELAALLASHYEKHGKSEEARRLNVSVAKAFEHFGKLGNGMTGAHGYKEAEAAYRKAGRSDEAREARMGIEAKVVQAKEEMKTISAETRITDDQIKDFLTHIIDDDAGQTLFNISGHFLIKRKEQEEHLTETAKQAPFWATVPVQVMSDNRVTAIVGSVHEDLHGRLIYVANQGLSFDAIWLREGLKAAVEKHKLAVGHFVGWANRHDLYEDLTLVAEGIDAWFKEDHAKVMHVLVPQIEQGLRSIVAQLGRPTTRPHPRVNGASLALNMGDILNDDEVVKALGPNLVLHFLAIYADPRGRNLRNELAHGLIAANAMHEFNSRILIHTLLVLGAWKELARPLSGNSN